MWLKFDFIPCTWTEVFAVWFHSVCNPHSMFRARRMSMEAGSCYRQRAGVISLLPFTFVRCWLVGDRPPRRHACVAISMYQSSLDASWVQCGCLALQKHIPVGVYMYACMCSWLDALLYIVVLVCMQAKYRYREHTHKCSKLTFRLV